MKIPCPTWIFRVVKRCTSEPQVDRNLAPSAVHQKRSAMPRQRLRSPGRLCFWLSHVTCFITVTLPFGLQSGSCQLNESPRTWHEERNCGPQSQKCKVFLASCDTNWQPQSHVLPKLRAHQLENTSNSSIGFQSAEHEVRVVPGCFAAHMFMDHLM